MVRVSRKRNVNVIRVGVKVIASVIGLYASGIMLQVMGDVMINTSSSFNTGLKLIGWTVQTTTNATSSEACNTPGGGQTLPGCITDTSGTGILAVIGLLAIVWVVFEFVDFSM